MNKKTAALYSAALLVLGPPPKRVKDDGLSRSIKDNIRTVGLLLAWDIYHNTASKWMREQGVKDDLTQAARFMVWAERERERARGRD